MRTLIFHYYPLNNIMNNHFSLNKILKNSLSHDYNISIPNFHFHFHQILEGSYINGHKNYKDEISLLGI